MDAIATKNVVLQNERYILNEHGYQHRKDIITDVILHEDAKLMKINIHIAARTSTEAVMSLYQTNEDSSYILSALSCNIAPESFGTSFKELSKERVDKCVDTLEYIYNICNK